jgi:hypothetical protein
LRAMSVASIERVAHGGEYAQRVELYFWRGVFRLVDRWLWGRVAVYHLDQPRDLAGVRTNLRQLRLRLIISTFQADQAQLQRGRATFG